MPQETAPDNQVCSSYQSIAFDCKAMLQSGSRSVFNMLRWILAMTSIFTDKTLRSFNPLEEYSGSLTRSEIHDICMQGNVCQPFSLAL